MLDPSFRDSPIEAWGQRLGCKVEWHEGFRLQLDQLLAEEDFRPSPAIEAITQLGIRTPADLSDARDKHLDYQTAKWVWHCIARFGRET